MFRCSGASRRAPCHQTIHQDPAKVARDGTNPDKQLTGDIRNQGCSQSIARMKNSTNMEVRKAKIATALSLTQGK